MEHKEVAKIAKGLGYVIIAFEKLSYFEPSTIEGPNIMKKYAKDLLKAIEHYKIVVPGEVREFLDNSDDIHEDFETINKLEAEVRDFLEGDSNK